MKFSLPIISAFIAAVVMSTPVPEPGTVLSLAELGARIKGRGTDSADDHTCSWQCEPNTVSNSLSFTYITLILMWLETYITISYLHYNLELLLCLSR